MMTKMGILYCNDMIKVKTTKVSLRFHKSCNWRKTYVNIPLHTGWTKNVEQKFWRRCLLQWIDRRQDSKYNNDRQVIERYILLLEQSRKGQIIQYSTWQCSAEQHSTHTVPVLDSSRFTFNLKYFVFIFRFRTAKLAKFNSHSFVSWARVVNRTSQFRARISSLGSTTRITTLINQWSYKETTNKNSHLNQIRAN